MALNPGQTQIALLLEHLAASRGLGPGRQREFAAAAMSESSLNPGAINQSSHAGGLFQLLSPGYRQTAQRLGGVLNPRANALAILPEYVHYWQTHPGAAPGQAAATVEASGEDPGFYARYLNEIPNTGASPAGGFPLAQRPQPGPDFRQLIAHALMAQHPDVMQVLQVAHQQHEAQQAKQGLKDGAQLADGLAPGPGKFGKVTLAPNADRPGARTSKAVLQFVARIAGLAGAPLTIGTGTNHSEYTVNGNVSDHWSGHAADIPATGARLIRLGRLALIAAGADPAWAMKQTGGLYNIGGHQIIFNTHIGGDHTNHLHVSAH
jgi:hypothetical protein